MAEHHAITTSGDYSDKCASPKIQGSETLLCELEPDHEHGDDGTWHQAEVTDHRRLDFGTCRIETSTREVITWEPFSEKLKRGLEPLRKRIAARETP
jgi:hypothetical protein